MKLRHERLTMASGLVVSMVLVGALASCAGQAVPVAGGAKIQERHFTLTLVPGPDYAFTSWWFIFPVQIYPQVACWLETPQGEFVDTIYVTAKGAKKSWMAAPKAGRPEALPVWFGIQKSLNASADTVTAATPSKTTVKDSSIPETLAAGTYLVKLEVNRSYDYNDTFTRANSGVTGQPSLIYSCAITIGDKPSIGVFVPIGTGSVDGSDGRVRSGLEGITTATRLFDTAEISYDNGGS